MSAAKYLASKVDHEAEGLELRAERDEALKALAGSRARFADSEARRAELEAVIQKASDICDIPLRVKVMGSSESESAMAALAATIKREALDAVPSVVLEDRDREVAAQARKETVEAVEWRFNISQAAQIRAVYDFQHASPEALNDRRERAAAIRKGDTA